MPDAKSRARGMMAGLAVGDALGSPAKGLSWQEIQERFGVLTDFRDSFPPEYVTKLAYLKRKDFDRAMRFWRRAGLYSEETQEAILLAYLLGRKGDIGGAEVAEEFQRMAGIPIVGPYLGAFRGSSDGFRTSIMTYRKAKDWRQCGVASSGPGAAARIPPVAFFFRADLDTMFWRVVEVSLVTHRDARALAAAYAVAWLTAHLASQEKWPGTAALEPLTKAVRAAEDRMTREYAEDLLTGPERANDFSWALERAVEAIRTRPEAILDEIVRAAKQRGEVHVTSPTDAFALTSVVTALVAALTQGGTSFENAVGRAVALGGETDTVGAIVGALCGVFHGIDAVPARWQDGLANIEGILRHGDGLVELQRDAPEPLDAESRLCAEEESARQAIAARVIKAT